MLKTVLAAGLAAAAGFGTFEDPPAKMTYSGANFLPTIMDGDGLEMNPSCEDVPPVGPRGADGTGYGFLAAYPMWDAKCFNENCARESGATDGGKTGGWTKNKKKCSTVESETVLDARYMVPGVAAGRPCNGGTKWRLQELCFEWCAEEATRLGYGSTKHPDPQYCCAFKYGGAEWTRYDASYDYKCQLSRDGKPGFEEGAGGWWTAIKVFSTSCSAEYADPAACAAD